jgi:ABC-type arginine/histidine transport system permease subunit
MIAKIIKKTILTTLLLLIPIAQFYAALIAFPLFLFPGISQSSALMEYTFGYFYPKSPLTVLIFVIYYLLFFYICEYRKEKII